MKNEKIFNICYLISEFVFIPVRVYKKNKLIKTYYPLEIPFDPIILYEDTILNLPNNINYYITVRYSNYSIVKYKNYKIIVGPTSMNEITKNNVRSILNSNKIDNDQIESVLGFFNSINKMSLDNLLKLTSLINLVLNNEYDESIFSKSKIKDLIVQKVFNERLNKEQFQNKKEKKYSKLFNDENTLLSTIASGNTDMVLKYTREIKFEDLNIQVDQIKQIKHRVVTTLTLISRTAIKKGIDYDIVGNMTDRYLNEIINTNDIHKINLIYNDMIISFTYLISEVSSNTSTLINKVNSYINSNITKNIKVNDIASALYVSRPYLSSFFKKETGQELSKHIYISKINYAKNLLSITNRSLREISEYLGFSSTSHFCSTFKKITGLTPKEFKANNTKY